MRQSYQIIYNAITNYGRTLIQGVVSFVLVPIVVGYIGKDSYGIVLLALSAFGMIELFGMGLSRAVTKHVAEQKAIGKIELVNTILNSSLLWFFVVGMVGTLAIFFLGLNFDFFFKDISPSLTQAGRYSMYLIAIIICPCLVLDVFKGLLSADQRYDLINFICVLSAVLRAGFIFIYLKFFGSSVVVVVGIYAFFHLAERVVTAGASFKLAPYQKVSFRFINRKGIKIIAEFASMILIALVANVLIAHLLKFIIGIELTLADVTNYGIILLLANTANMLVRNIINVLVPVASKYQGLANYNIIRKMFLHGTKYSVIIIIGTLGVMIPFLPGLLRVWMGPDFVSLWPVGVAMFISQIIITISICPNQILNGLGRVRYIAFVSLFCAICGIIVIWAYLHFRAEAALLGVVVLLVIYRVILSSLILIYGIKKVGLGIGNLLFLSVFKPLFVGLLVALTGIAIINFININSWLILIINVSLVEAVYIALTYMWCLDSEEKGRIKILLQDSYKKIYQNKLLKKH